MKSLFLSLLVSLALSAALPAASATNAQRTILFGINYLPHVTCVENFSPYWITDNWTEKRMTTDLKIMKAIGASVVRFHIYSATAYMRGEPGAHPDRYLQMLDLGVKVALDMGFKIHLDICSDSEQEIEKNVRFLLSRYKGRIESYQIENEWFMLPEEPGKLKWLQGIMQVAHSVDPEAKWTADFLIPDWVKVRDEWPDLYKHLDVIAIHYYPVTDYRGWNDLYISDLVDHVSNPTGRRLVETLPVQARLQLKDFGEYDAKAKSFDHGMYSGSAGWLDRDVWISEIASHGYWRWGNLTPEDKRATDWPKMVDAVAAAKNRVMRIYHHCFRDKMSSREFGMGQSGIVYYDGAPRAATFAFKKTAVKYAPPGSSLKALDCEIARARVPSGAKSVNLTVKLTNTSATTLKGSAVLELPDGAKAETGSFNFALAPKASKVWTVRVDVSDMPWGNNHVFARVNIPQGLAYGWGVISNPTRMVVNAADAEPAASVRYVNGIEAVQEFLDKYGDDCAIVTGPSLGNDAEMGYRLKTIIQAMRCREVPVRSSILALDVLNRPLIVIGDPLCNLISRTVEFSLPQDLHVTAVNPGAGKGLINVVKEPFGKMEAGGRFSRQSEQLGYYFGACPAALYISGSDNDGVRAAAYDLIRRTWGADEKYR